MKGWSPNSQKRERKVEVPVKTDWLRYNVTGF